MHGVAARRHVHAYEPRRVAALENHACLRTHGKGDCVLAAGFVLVVTNNAPQSIGAALLLLLGSVYLRESLFVFRGVTNEV